MPHSASACFRKIRKITKKIEMDRYERVWTLETYSLNFSFTSYLAHSTLRHRQSDHDRCEDQKPGLENFVLIVLLL